MSFRIVHEPAADVSTLKLFGALDAEGLVALQDSYETCEGPVGLDLSHLRSVDDVGAAYLRGLVDAGAPVVGANPYVAALLHLGGPGRRGSRASPSAP